jgi:hypothetical protein
VGRRNIYIREEDEGVWDKASALAGEDSMSQIIIRGLRAYVSGREGDTIEWLTVSLEDEFGQRSTKKFQGRWLIKDFHSAGVDAFVAHPETSHVTTHDCDVTPWWVAETGKGQIAVWADPAGGDGGFYVFKDLDEAEEHGVPGDIISAAANKLGISRAEVLDI